MKKIFISGNLGRDAEKKLSGNNREFITFSLANSEPYDKDEQGNPKTTWYRVTSFSHSHMLQYLTKGKGVVIIGRYSDDAYINKTTNAPEISRDIIAESIEFWSNGERNNGDSGEKPAVTTQTAVQSPSPAPKSKKSTQSATPLPSTEDVKIPSSDDDDLPF